ncbi:MAG: hypothetical protein AAGC64_03095 [Bacteroidota bacterium]
MNIRILTVTFMFIAMFTLVDHVDAQRTNKYKRLKQNSKKLSRYHGTARRKNRFQPYFYVGSSINAGNYFGDLAPRSEAASTDISFTRPGLGIYGGYKFHHSLALRGGFNWIRVYGDDFSADPNGNESEKSRYVRNLSFRNDIKEFQLGLEIYLLPNFDGPYRRLPFNIYLFVGGTIYHHAPHGLVPNFDYQSDTEGDGIFEASNFELAPQAGEWVNLRKLKTEGESYSSVGFSIPLSIGAHMALPGTPFNLGVEFGIRYLFTDYIDDVSGQYLALDSFEDPLARIMSDKSTVPVSSRDEARDLTILNINQETFSNGETYFIESNNGTGLEGSVRGDPNDNDLIFVTQLKITYIFGGVIRRRAKYR